MNRGTFWVLASVAALAAAACSSEDTEPEPTVPTGTGTGTAATTSTGTGTGTAATTSTGTATGTATGSGTATGTGGGTATGTGGGTATGTGTGDPHRDLHQRCIDKINELRATLGRPPLGRWLSAETCADEQATADMASGTAHGSFGDCGEWGQNECPGWGWESVEACLESMWGEKDQPNCTGCDACADAYNPNCPDCDFYGPPPCGHYVNMSALYFSEAACGFSEIESGGWIVIDFH